MTRIVFRLAFAGIRHRLLASVLTILLSAAAAATVVVALEVGATGRDPWERTFDAAHGADVLASVRSEGDALAIAAQPGVAEAAEPIPSSLVHMRTVDGPGDDVSVILAGLRTPPSVNVPVVTDGEAPGGPGVVLERSFAQALGLRPGMTIALSNDGASTELNVIGTAILPSQPPLSPQQPGSGLGQPRWAQDGRLHPQQDHHQPHHQPCTARPRRGHPVNTGRHRALRRRFRDRRRQQCGPGDRTGNVALVGSTRARCHDSGGREPPSQARDRHRRGGHAPVRVKSEHEMRRTD